MTLRAPHPDLESLVRRGPGPHGPPKAGDASPESLSQIEERLKRSLGEEKKKREEGGVVASKGKRAHQRSVIKGMPSNAREFWSANPSDRHQFLLSKIESLKRQYHHKTAEMCVGLASELFNSLHRSYLASGPAPEFGEKIVKLIDELLTLCEKRPVDQFMISRLKDHRRWAQILIDHGIEELDRYLRDQNGSGPFVPSKQ